MPTLSRNVASFDAIKPVPDLNGLDGEFNQLVGTAGALNGGGSGKRILVKYNHATEPVLELDQLGAGALQQWKQNGVEKARVENDGDLVSNGITTAAGVVTFGSIPVGPASDPTTANQYTRKQYIDDRVHFSFSFPIADPSTAPTNNIIPGSVAFISPDGVNLTLTKGSVYYQTGAHTSGGSVTFQFQRRTAASTWTSITNFATLTLDNTNNSVFVVYTNDFADVTLAPGDTLVAFISARSGTITERDVVVSIQGTR